MFRVNYCGYNVYNSDKTTISRPGGGGDYLFLLFLTPFEIIRNKKSEISKPNACLIYSPGEPQLYTAVNIFKNSYVHFLPGAKANLITELPMNRVFYPKNYLHVNNLIKQINLEHIQKSRYYSDKTNALMEQLLIDLLRDVHNSSSDLYNSTLYEKFQRIRLELISRCEYDWSGDKMCELAGMEKSQFYDYYKKFFNISPKADIINARIDKAKLLLTSDALKVCEVAELCGFKNSSHFSRYFKKTCLCSPNEYGKPIGDRL